ncbi:hypothetical protein [Priestia koreensis]|uniref:hypothetical protein n=1 Tax=Priestia koreensis TaxID=284581 RepID=UPI001F579C4C|nr:hypothetical protein [Priestia koreensis]UNL83704.1 hypothetical protein IE339_16240 [Priestia koreensis]
MITDLQTTTVLLKEFVFSDWEYVHTYAAREEVCRYQTWGPNTKEDSKQFVQQILADNEEENRILRENLFICDGWRASSLYAILRKEWIEKGSLVERKNFPT